MNDNEEGLWEVTAASVAKYPRFIDDESLAALLWCAKCPAESSPLFRERNFDRLLACRLVDHVIAGTISTALCEDSPSVKDQDKLNRIRADLRKFVDSLPDGVWKDRLIPAADGFHAGLDTSLFLKVAGTQRSRGAPTGWKKDVIMFRWLALYKIITGESPTYTDNGPTERFLKHLSAIAVNWVNASRYPESGDAVKVRTLWRSVDVGFRDWFRKRSSQSGQQKRSLDDEISLAMVAIEESFRQLEQIRMVASQPLI